MTQLIYTEAELMRSVEYCTPQIEAEHRLHGGFDAGGRYVPPRTLFREPAFAAWTQQLRDRGGDLMRADASLLAGLRFPSIGQQKLLLAEGLGQSFWNTLTITGRIEGKGRLLAEIEWSNLQDVIVENISEMAIGHLNNGLLRAHGIDEGGQPELGIGGHDTMWFALRDLAFGSVDYPEPPETGDIRRPEDAQRQVPPINPAHHSMIYFLLNLLLIEFRAERGFAMTEQLLRDPELFCDRRKQAERAAKIVDRIRQDEVIHVMSLRLYLGEIRSCTFKTIDGGTIAGSEIVDPFWAEISHWATDEQPKLVAADQRKLYRERILAHAEGERILEEFDALEEISYDGS